MSQTKSVLRDLEEAIARGTAESRARALWHTTDLLIAGRYCEEDVATFGDEIEVAGPVLRESERLDNEALVANASTKSQAHLLAISQRRSIAENVTDVLVRRGNQEVVNSVARN